MGKKGTSGTGAANQPAATAKATPAALLDTRVVYCGDNLEQLAKLPDSWLRRAKASPVDMVYIDPAPVSEAELPFNSNRNKTKGKQNKGDKPLSDIMNQVASREVPGKTPVAGLPFTLPRQTAHNGIAKADRGAAEGVGPWGLPA